MRQLVILLKLRRGGEGILILCPMSAVTAYSRDPTPSFCE